MVRLTPRLAAVASLVPEGAVAADIGCDHGYLAIRLVSSGRSPRAIASDVHEGPLSRAAENVAAAGLSERISLRLGDGLSQISPEEVSCVILAGMGGDTIREVIDAAPWLWRGAHTLVLQPQSRTDALRRYLAVSGFSVLAERVVCERGHAYCAFSCRRTGEGDVSPLHPYVSPALLALPRAERAPYTDRLLQKLEKRRAGLAASGRAPEELQRLDDLLRDLRKAL